MRGSARSSTAIYVVIIPSPFLPSWNTLQLLFTYAASLLCNVVYHDWNASLFANCTGVRVLLRCTTPPPLFLLLLLLQVSLLLQRMTLLLFSPLEGRLHGGGLGRLRLSQRRLCRRNGDGRGERLQALSLWAERGLGR